MGSQHATRVLVTAATVLSTAALLAGCAGSKSPAHAVQLPAKASSTASLASLPPAQILSKALAAATAAGSMHFTVTGRSSSGETTDVQNASSDAGNQVIRNPHGTLTARMVGGVGYFRASAAVLAQILPGKPVSRFAGRWIAAGPGDPGYADITEGLTLGSALAEFTPTGTLTSTGPQTVDGEAIIGVKGVAAANTGVPQGQPAILYVKATGQPLPVSYQAGVGADREVATFSHWGEAVHPAAPAHPVPITSLMPSGPAVS
jgi:hypothetical protein